MWNDFVTSAVEAYASEEAQQQQHLKKEQQPQQQQQQRFLLLPHVDLFGLFLLSRLHSKWQETKGEGDIVQVGCCCCCCCPAA